MSERARAEELLNQLEMSERRKRIYKGGIERATEADLAAASDGLEAAFSEVDAALETADQILARQRERTAAGRDLASAPRGDAHDERMVGRRTLPPVPRIIAVSGGKGGVGKSTIALNLAIALSKLGHRVTLVDADLGAANLHTMLGVLSPTTGLGDFLDHRVDTLDALKTPVVVPTLSLVSGSSRPGAANLSKGDKLRLLSGIAHLDADCVVLDVGAGSSFNVVDFVAAADHKLLVLTPQLPSLHNAYALLKACVYRVIRRLALDDVQQGLVDSALDDDTWARTVAQRLAVLRPLDTVLGDRIADTLARFGVGIVANQVETAADAAALSRMSPLIHDHLQIHSPLIATIRRSPSLAGGLHVGGGTLATDDGATPFRKLAQALLCTDLDQLRGAERIAAQHAHSLWGQRDTVMAET